MCIRDRNRIWEVHPKPAVLLFTAAEIHLHVEFLSVVVRFIVVKKIVVVIIIIVKEAVLVPVVGVLVPVVGILVLMNPAPVKLLLPGLCVYSVCLLYTSRCV